MPIHNEQTYILYRPNVVYFLCTDKPVQRGAGYSVESQMVPYMRMHTCIYPSALHIQSEIMAFILQYFHNFVVKTHHASPKFNFNQLAWNAFLNQHHQLSLRLSSLHGKALQLANQQPSQLRNNSQKKESFKLTRTNQRHFRWADAPLVF